MENTRSAEELAADRNTILRAMTARAQNRASGSKQNGHLQELLRVQEKLRKPKGKSCQMDKVATRLQREILLDPVASGHHACPRMPAGTLSK